MPAIVRTVSDVTDLPPGMSEGDLLDGKYRIGAAIGAGAMGTVVAAHHVELDRKVAIKFLKPDAIGHADAVARFFIEARAAARLRSDHVAHVYDVGKLECGGPYIVMEYLDGCDLSEWLRRYHALPLEQAVDFVLQACDAIAEAHDHRIIHRDVKPANLFAVKRGCGSPRIKVLDFGISKTEALVSDTLPPGVCSPLAVHTEETAMVGSPFYMSPEQMESARDVDARTDVWSLGITLSELVTGKLPFKARSLVELYATIISGVRASVCDAVPGTPPAIDDILNKCLATKREDRFATVRELAAALAPYGSQGPQSPFVSRPGPTVECAPSTPPAPNTEFVAGASVPPPRSLIRAVLTARWGSRFLVGAVLLGAPAVILPAWTRAGAPVSQQPIEKVLRESKSTPTPPGLAAITTAAPVATATATALTAPAPPAKVAQPDGTSHPMRKPVPKAEKKAPPSAAAASEIENRSYTPPPEPR